MKKASSWTLALVCVLILFTLIPPGMAMDSAEVSPDAAEQRIDRGLLQAMQASGPKDKIPIIIAMKKQANLSAISAVSREERVRKVVEVLQDTANTTQGPIQAFLRTQRDQGRAGPVTRFWIFNGLAVSVNSAAVDHLAARPDVDRISLDQTFQAPSSVTSTAAPEPNLAAINAPALWDLGYRGQGIVVANVDTGVYLYHPDLNAQWRGGTNSWFDPNNEHVDTPTDLSGHGTQTMGIMVGREAGGTAIGVAPDAQWIAVKIFDDQGQATTAGIHAAYQWLLDPDGNPSTPDAPHVVNSSWSFGSPGCNLEFQLDLQALRAANILPVFSAGNFGPSGATSASPANNPEAFAIGAIDDYGLMYTESSRGPSSCGEGETVFPEMVAPGVGIRTTERYDLYTDATGTSMAAPHVVGALALLLSAYPQLTVEEQLNALLAGAFDLGPAGPDNSFGYGGLDVLAAYEFLSAGGPPPTPTPVPTTPTPDAGTNLALQRPVMVSSFRDDAHTGDKAVDGDMASYWQTKKAVGKNVLPSEWIVVDLGSSTPVGAVELEWDSNYATSYSIQISNDNSAWMTVFSTTSGDGGNDTIAFTTATARYVRMDSTAWSSASQRNWLKEIEVFAGGASPPPTSTPTPTPVPTLTPTPGATTTVHVGDLDGSSDVVKNRWNATIMILVHNAAEEPVAGASVSGTWSGGATGGASCVTDVSGWCSVVKTNLKGNVSSVTWTVSDVVVGADVYQPTDNHDPEADSDGSTITVLGP